MSVRDTQRPSLVLVTGGTGAFGHRVVDELLKEGYTVRAVCRPAKAEVLKAIFHSAGERLEIVEMDDLMTADWSEPLKGVDAIIHVASPVPREGNTNKMVYDGAVIGTKRLLVGVGQSLNVKRFVLTGSVAAYCKLDLSNAFEEITFDENTFGPAEEDDELDVDSLPPEAAYIASKCITDKLVWKAAEEYPHIDFTTIFAPGIYGKFLEGYPISGNSKSTDSLNTNQFIYHLLQPERMFPPWLLTAQAHSSDTARAHVLALTAPRLTDGRKKRLNVCQGYVPWKETVEYIGERRPEIKDRLPGAEKMKEGMERPGAQTRFKLYMKLTEEVLGLKHEDYKPWRETVLEVVDWVLDWEKSVAAAA